jgi:hypothetical protein
MRSFEPQPDSWPTCLLMTDVSSPGLTACNGKCRSALLEQAKASIAKGDTKAAIRRAVSELKRLRASNADFPLSYRAQALLNQLQTKSRRLNPHIAPYGASK